MALQFDPPDWLVREYYNRQNPVEGLADTLRQISRDNLEQREARRRDMLARQEMANREEQNRMTGLSQFHKTANPQFLPKNVQYALANPVQGPGVPVPYDVAQQSQLGGAEGPALPMETPPQESPIIAYYRDFMKQNPMGTEGMTTDTIMRPLPGGGYIQEQVRRPRSGKTIVDRGSAAGVGADGKPRTYQEKQEIYDNDGNPTGYMVFDTKSGTKSFVPYQTGQIPQGSTFGPKVKPAIPAGVVEKQVAQEGILDLVKTLRETYKPEFTGPLQGRLREAGQKYDIGATEDEAKFGRTVADLRSIVVNERTGAAVGERQEWDRLMQLIPDDKKSDKDFLSKLESFEDRYKKIIANRTKEFKSSGYRNPLGGASTRMEDMTDDELQRIINGQ